MDKRGIDELLVRAALEADFRRRLETAPEDALSEYDLTDEQRDILRRPDSRLLRLLGEALTRQSAPPSRPEPPRDAPHAWIAAGGRSLPELALALTIVPCAQVEDGQVTRFSYAVWVNPLPEGTDPASLPPPPGAVLPGQPLTPLHAVVELSALQRYLPSGHAPVVLWASLRQATNCDAPAPAETRGEPSGPPFGSDLEAPWVRDAVAAVRTAGAGERYARLVDLLRVLRNGLDQ